MDIVLNKELNKNIIIFMLGFTLNHTMIISNVNTSAADLFLIILLYSLLLNYSNFKLPFTESFFIIWLSFFLLFVPLVIVPLLINVIILPEEIFKGYIKYLVVFCYFFIGYNFISEKNIKFLYIGILSSSSIMSTFGVIAQITKNKTITDLFYFDGLRLQGAMNDPNYFAIHQLISTIIIIRTNMKLKYKIIISILMIISIVLSGSKTGLFATVIILAFLLLNKLKYRRNFFSFSLLTTSAIIFIAFGRNFILEFVKGLNIFSINRLLEFSTGIESALVSDGSGRTAVWNNAYEMIKLSPIFGVGAGSYLEVSKNVFGIDLLAHNTYLQLLVEWGIPLTFLFFGYIIFNVLSILKSSKVSNLRYTIALIILVFLLGSLSISLNNSRLFWLSLGIMISFKKIRTDKIKIK